MAIFGPGLSSIAFLLLFLLHSCLLSDSAKQNYIIQMNHNMKPTSYPTHEAWYSDNLQTLTSSPPANSLLYTYDAAYHGFAASLTAAEAETLGQSEAVLGVYEDTLYTLHTTRTPEFLGLDTHFDHRAGPSLQEMYYKASQNVIIGVLDTGVTPGSMSFHDEGMTDVPARWKGKCEFDSKKKCNKKLIGARSFQQGHDSSASTKETSTPLDRNGHGTHTASTAAGAVVQNASLFGYASGNARGMAPGARLAIYKVCGDSGCSGSDILAAMDSAISDGVDVLSMSLGGEALDYYRDIIAIGAFAAMEKGIVVSCSAGNNGPAVGSVTNVAPWIMTVGAGTLDRDFPAFVTLGNKQNYTGMSLYNGKGMGNEFVELVYYNDWDNSRLCLEESLKPADVTGKVVICDRGTNGRVEKGNVVMRAGGVGMILANTKENGEKIVADSHILPAVAVGMKLGTQIKEYVKKNKRPVAVLSFGGTVVNVKPSPVVAAFSSRGPNSITREILKPDLIGPGVNILAAWPDDVGPTELDVDNRKTNFNIVSGTSMSCPHISGLAALLKAAHPDWSPSAIKSALMTTAYTVDNTNSPLHDAVDNSISTPYAHGAGYVNPKKALAPGLVYNITTADYVSFVCSLNYRNDYFQQITQRNKNKMCKGRFKDPGQLNYPSFSVLFRKSNDGKTLSRVLTNVESARSIYTVSVKAPTNVKVKVNPTKLVFEKVGDKKTYTVTFESKSRANDAFGSIVWKNEAHTVRSPVSFAWS